MSNMFVEKAKFTVPGEITIELFVLRGHFIASSYYLVMSTMYLLQDKFIETFQSRHKVNQVIKPRFDTYFLANFNLKLKFLNLKYHKNMKF